MIETFTKEELKNSTIIYDKLTDHFQKIAKDSSILRKYKIEIARIMDKNSDVLQTPIIGKQFLINKLDEEKLINILGYDQEKLLQAYKESPFFKQFEKDLLRKDQLIFAIPLIIYAYELEKLNKNMESRFIYFSAFFKAYASRISISFPHGINEDRMQYVVEYCLNDRFDIKKLGNVAAVIKKISDNSYDNYLPQMKNKLSDSLLYDIFVSGISTRLSSTLKSVAEIYYKNAGNYLAFERNSAISTDEDSEGSSYGLEIKSNAAVKQDIARKAIVKISTSPLDDEIIRQSVKMCFKPYSELYVNTTRITLKEIVDKRRKDLAEFFDALLGTFLYGIDPSTGEKYTSSDVRTVKFILNANNVYKASHTKDQNINRVKELIKDFLNQCSLDYMSYKSDTQKRFLEKSILMYFTLFLKKVA